MSSLPEIKTVVPVDGFRLQIEFADGATGVHDLSWALKRVTLMNEALHEQTFFERVFVERGALVWPNGFDLSPWNIRLRMEEAGELALPSTSPATDEQRDLRRVQQWFATRNIDATRVHHNNVQGKTPDLRLESRGELIGWCEVKSRQGADWRAIYDNDQIYEIGAQGKDPTFNSLAKYVVTAHDQLIAADPTHSSLWVVAIVNNDDRIDVFDFR